MKIALVSQEYPPETAHGGIATQTYSKAIGLSLLGHQVYVISRSIDTKRHETKEGDITVIRIPGMEEQIPEMSDIVQWITHSVVVAAEIEALNKLVGLDIIDFPEWAAEGYTYLLNRTDWNNIPVVIQLHGPLVMFAHALNWPDLHSEFYRIGSEMEATCIRLADAVYSSSECSANWVRNHYNYQEQHIPVIHLGIDTIKFAPQPVQKYERPTIIFIGKIVQNKGVEELVEAASNLVIDFPHLHLKIAGKGNNDLITKLRQLSGKSGANDLLEFSGFISKEELPIELSKAHVFAAPSYYEGGPGFVYLEAMACGLTVIGCSGSGLDEIIQHEINGLLIPPGNVKALEEALRKILNNQTEAKTIGINARNYILKECDSRVCIKKVEEFYYSVLQSHSMKTETI